MQKPDLFKYMDMVSRVSNTLKAENVKTINQMQNTGTGTHTYLDAGVVGVGLSACRMGQQDVLWFQVSVDDPFGLKDPHGPRDLQQEYSDGVFT